jgi:hypothetical protein
MIQAGFIVDAAFEIIEDDLRQAPPRQVIL